VIDLGLSTTVEIAVPLEKADGELFLLPLITKQWNALKLLNDKGEFLNGIEGEKILAIAASV
jgi:phosphomannomutase